MLRYRSLFTVVDRKSTVDDVFAQVHAWLRSKRYDADALTWEGPVVTIGSNAEALLVTERGKDGSRSGMFLLQEHGPDGTWTTQVVAQDPGNGRRRDDWAWIDVDGPKVAGIPRVARDVLDVLDATDGRASLAAHPTVVRGREVEEVLAALLDKDRRALVFVAGSTPDFPLAKWQEYVGGLLHDTVGLAAGYVLDADATALLREAIGQRHAVEPGTLRTFLPGVDPTEDLDALRHRFLSVETLLRTDQRRIARTLGTRARDVALAAEVPTWARHTRERLEALADAKYFESRVQAMIAADEAAGATTVAAPVTPETHAAARLEVEVPAIESPRSEVFFSADPELDRVALGLFGQPLDAALLRALADTRRGEAERVAEMERVTERLAALQREQLEVSARLDEQRERADREAGRARDAAALIAAVREEREDIELEWTDSLHRIDEMERQVRALRKRLIEAGAHDAAWTPVDLAPTDKAPETFAELLERVANDLTRVAFTGDSENAHDLDVSLPYGGSSVKAWAALLALEDYARLKADGTFSGGVRQYLEKTPDGRHGYSMNRWAGDESEDVQKHAKFREPRVLPVPTTVEPSGSVFMGAHFKLANVGLISPRLHYHDATAKDGHIYVGYIGAHLPTGKTN